MYINFLFHVYIYIGGLIKGCEFETPKFGKEILWIISDNSKLEDLCIYLSINLGQTYIDYLVKL